MTHEQFLLMKLAEEASEIAQIALKTAQFGMTERHPDMALNNKQRIHLELNDLLAVVEELNGLYQFDFRPDHKAKIQKLEKLKKYLGYSIQLGKVESPESNGGWIDATNNPPSFNSNDSWIVTDGFGVYSNFYWIEEFYDNGKHFPTGWYHESDADPTDLKITHYRAKPALPVLVELAEDVVLRDSPEAATEITVTAWQSRKGLIYLDQNIARWDGSTHRLCKRGHLIPKQGYCELCEPLDNQEEYATYSTQKWNDEVLYSMANDTWFFDKESVLNALKESGKSAQELMLVLTEPTFAQEIDPDDYYEGDLPDGITVPDEIETAFDVLNEAIKNCNTPLCYYPSKIAAIIDIDMDAVK